MFDRYQLNVRPHKLIPEIETVKTNTDLIYVFDDLLSQKILDDIARFDFDQLDWKHRPNHYAGGGTCRYVLGPGNPLRPAFLITTKKHIVNLLKQVDPDVDIEAVCLEFFIRSRNDGASGQAIHKDCQEVGPIWTFLVHLKGEDGPTEFVEEAGSTNVVASVDFRPGRVVVFPSLYSHHGLLPTSGDRYILNSIVRLKNFGPTSRILDKSPELAKFNELMLK